MADLSPYENLKLRYAGKCNSIIAEIDRELRHAQESPRGGGQRAMIGEIQLRKLGRLVSAVVESVQELLNLGHIMPTPDWLQRTSQMVDEVCKGFKHGMTMGSNPMLASFNNELPWKIDGASTNAKMRLKIMFSDAQQAEKQKKLEQRDSITIKTLNVTGIANFGTIEGDITQNLSLVRNAGSQQIADFLEDLTQKVLADSCLERQNQQEAMENIRTISQEASLPAENRTIGVVKAALTYIPSLLSASVNLLNYFQLHLEKLKAFFNIAG